jgi:putative toxin-antitoxin system antitoxin component (TIGR02293 family)
MSRTAYIVDLLGGAKVFRGARVSTVMELHRRIRAGLPYGAFKAVLTRFRLSQGDVAAVLHVPPRTLARRRKSQRLPPAESDRLYRLAWVGAQAVAALGSEDKAAMWLQRPNRALDNQVPLRMLDTDIGSRQVEEILGRIEHGIAS